MAAAAAPCRRLRRLSAHVTPSPRSSVLESPILALLPLRVDGTDSHGCFSPCVSGLKVALGEATTAGNFRAAAALSDLLAVVEPKPLLSVDECAPSDPDDAARFFLENGFVCIRELFPPQELCRVQAAWRRAQEPARGMWEAAKAMGVGTKGLYYENQEELAKLHPLPMGRLFFDIPVEQHFFAEAEAEDGDPILLDLIDPPKLVEVLHRIIGPDVVLCGMQPRTVPPEEEGGYTSWVSLAMNCSRPARNSCAANIRRWLATGTASRLSRRRRLGVGADRPRYRQPHCQGFHLHQRRRRGPRLHVCRPAQVGDRAFTEIPCKIHVLTLSGICTSFLTGKRSW
jgi:hypothetical protein